MGEGAQNCPVAFPCKTTSRAVLGQRSLDFPHPAAPKLVAQSIAKRDNNIERMPPVPAGLNGPGGVRIGSQRTCRRSRKNGRIWDNLRDRTPPRERETPSARAKIKNPLLGLPAARSPARQLAEVVSSFVERVRVVAFARL